jgi:hypothetical protein
MRERAEGIGGRLKVRSRPGDGTVVELSVPGHIAFPSQRSKTNGKSVSESYSGDLGPGTTDAEEGGKQDERSGGDSRIQRR